MSRTADIQYSDTAHAGGWLFANAGQLLADSANLVLTRNAATDWSLNRIAAGAETFNLIFSSENLRRILETYNFQEQFGGTQGPIPLAGRPPYTGATQLVPPTTAPSKGISITDVVVIYQVGVANLTSAALVLNKVAYANNVALAKTAMPIAATALPLVVQANPYVVSRAVTTPGFVVDDLSDVMAEFQIVMANTGTIRIYGMGFHCNFNYL